MTSRFARASLVLLGVACGGQELEDGCGRDSWEEEELVIPAVAGAVGAAGTDGGLDPRTCTEVCMAQVTDSWTFESCSGPGPMPTEAEVQDAGQEGGRALTWLCVDAGAKISTPSSEDAGFGCAPPPSPVYRCRGRRLMRSSA